MTISSRSGTRRNIKSLVLLAFKRAGLANVRATSTGYQWDRDFLHAKQLLDVILDSLQAKTILARAFQTQELDVVSGQRTIPVDGLDVIGDGRLVENSKDQLVKQVGEDYVNNVLSHGSVGVPTHFYMDFNADQPLVTLWPTPSSDDKMRVRVHRHLADADGELVDIDLPVYWDGYLVYALAADLMRDNSANIGRISEMQRSADVEFERCSIRGGTKGPVHFRPEDSDCVELD